jgi:drug/metabolite transporter (DMT)-like permease
MQPSPPWPIHPRIHRNMPHSSSKVPSTLALIMGLSTLYLVWGSTYLAIRVAVETLPPFLMSGFRFLVAAAIMIAWITVTRGLRMTWSQLFYNALVGACMLLGGNGLVSWAEQEISSGVATLVVSLSPLFLVLLDWLVLSLSGGKLGDRPALLTFVGIAVGGAGLVLLVGPDWVSSTGAKSDGWRMLALVAACFFWSAGSLMTRYATEPLEPFTGAALQMFWGGVWLVATGWLVGEGVGLDVGKFSANSVLAWCYLVVAGSLIAFTTYVWLMKHFSPALISTYSYINPIVAVFLGWLILDETVNSRIFAASSVIVLGVALITISRSQRKRKTL